MEDYLQYCDPGVTAKEYKVQTAQQVRLRIIHFMPPEKSAYPPVLMVVGLATFIQSFEGIIRGMTRHFELYYVETREKVSAELTGRVAFDIATTTQDIVAVIRHLSPQCSEYLLFGYSFGATAIADAYQQLHPKPKALLLLSPTPHFYFPKWSLPLIRIAPAFYPMIKTTAKWYLRNFVINHKEDKEMYSYTSYALDHCDPVKLSKAILSIAGYSVWDKLHHIDCDTLIVDTSKDGIHRHEDIIRLSTAISHSTYIDLEVNKRTHGAELADVILQYLGRYNAAKDGATMSFPDSVSTMPLKRVW